MVKQQKHWQIEEKFIEKIEDEAEEQEIKPSIILNRIIEQYYTEEETTITNLKRKRDKCLNIATKMNKKIWEFEQQKIKEKEFEEYQDEEIRIRTKINELIKNEQETITKSKIQKIIEDTKKDFVEKEDEIQKIKFELYQKAFEYGIPENMIYEWTGYEEQIKKVMLYPEQIKIVDFLKRKTTNELKEEINQKTK